MRLPFVFKGVTMNNTQAMNPSATITGAANLAHDAVNAAQEKATPAIDRAANAAHRTINRAADAATPAAEWASSTSQAIATRSTDAVEVCSSYVRERPLTVVLGALAIGFFMGKVLR
jgi:ElaB/YqjD/DUF883 family membrane-anchored ribosome-binding protein